MPSLADLTLQTSYHKGRDDIASDFYLPCLRQASEYDRAVGYFRSTVFIIAWPVLRDFVERSGKIRLLCSQVLSDEDIEALSEGYSARLDHEISSRLKEEVLSMLRDPALERPARILGALVASGIIELRIALLRDRGHGSAKGRIFHDKLGVFRDSSGNTVIFKGSMNETWSGLAADGNLESVDVAASWMGARDLERTRREQEYFDQIWENRYPTLNVRPFPEVAKEELQRAADLDWADTLEAMLGRQDPDSKHKDPRGRTLRSHQAAGLASWAANDYAGILAFATGSGKTFTAISAIREAISIRGQVVLLVVPDQVLFNQWDKEIRDTLADLRVRVLRAGAGFNAWRQHLSMWTEAGPERRLVLATIQTASTEEFRRRLRGGRHVLLVADEVHRLGSPKYREVMENESFGPRLGLSATPERSGDAEGTAAILSFFRGVLKPRYSLADAVNDGVLTRYFYHPHAVDLSEDELDAWVDLSREIATLIARTSPDKEAGLPNDRLKHLYIKRSRIVKHAAAKVPLAVDVLTTEYQAGQRWIIYCEDQRQLNEVSESLLNSGIQNMPFHSAMEGDRQTTLRWLESRGGVIVAIRCLDEGVDIPSVTHALILASSKNPREFIQRRGRVLRQASGKSIAHVHDAIVVPPKGALVGEDQRGDPITVGELSRALEFAQSADNPGADSDLRQIALEMGIEWNSLLAIGVEDEED